MSRPNGIEALADHPTGESELVLHMRRDTPDPVKHFASRDEADRVLNEDREQ